MTNREEVIRALRLLFSKGDVFEVRILKAVSANYMRPHTESGYFDFEHIPQAADAIAKIRAFAGAYVTLNPVDPDLLARAFNRLGPAEQNATTADDDVVLRRWLPIDCDAVRKSNISSTDEEHKAALELADQIRNGLASVGWPQPIVLDSGNGAQLLYRIDLPAKDDGLVQNVITSIAAASTEQVHVDLTVFNPARIWRLPGTMNCKGDSIPSRPHRMANIVSVPDKVQTVSRELLVAATGVEQKPEPAPVVKTDAFDLDTWILHHGLDVDAPVPYNGGRKWVFKVCPFNPKHTNRSAVLIEEPNGAIGFRCHHNSCSGNDWRKLREMCEPGCYDKPKPQEPVTVDISGLVKPKPVDIGDLEKKENSIEFTGDPGKISEKLLHVPGLIDEITDFSMSCAPKPNRLLSFCGALSCLSLLVGRNVADTRNNRANIYLIALAGSGVGKDHPRRITKTIACAAKPAMNQCIANSFASGEALEDALFISPSMLFQVDEIDTLINSMKSGDPRAEAMIGKMLEIFTSSSSSYTIRSKAMGRAELIKRKKEQKEKGFDSMAVDIQNPYLVIFGTAIPEMFFQSLNKRLLANGLIARCLIFEAGERGKKNHAQFIKVPESIIRQVRTILHYGQSRGNLCVEFPTPMIIQATEDAAKLLDKLDDKYDEIYSKYDKLKAIIPTAFWARAFEKVCKLSILYAVSENVNDPVISVDAVKWASQFVEYQINKTLFLTNSYTFENPFDEKCQKALRYIREAGGTSTHSALLKRMHESKDMFRQIIATLQENGSIVAGEYGTEAGRKIVYYRLTADSPKSIPKS